MIKKLMILVVILLCSLETKASDYSVEVMNSFNVLQSSDVSLNFSGSGKSQYLMTDDDYNIYTYSCNLEEEQSSIVLRRNNSDGTIDEFVGELAEKRRYGNGSVAEIVIDSQKNIYMALSAKWSTGGSHSDYLYAELLKFDSELNLIWRKEIEPLRRETFQPQYLKLKNNKLIVFYFGRTYSGDGKVYFPYRDAQIFSLNGELLQTVNTDTPECNFNRWVYIGEDSQGFMVFEYKDYYSSRTTKSTIVWLDDNLNEVRSKQMPDYISYRGYDDYDVYDRFYSLNFGDNLYMIDHEGNVTGVDNEATFTFGEMNHYYMHYSSVNMPYVNSYELNTTTDVFIAKTYDEQTQQLQNLTIDNLQYVSTFAAIDAYKNDLNDLILVMSIYNYNQEQINVKVYKVSKKYFETLNIDHSKLGDNTPLIINLTAIPDVKNMKIYFDEISMYSGPVITPVKIYSDIEYIDKNVQIQGYDSNLTPLTQKILIGKLNKKNVLTNLLEILKSQNDISAVSIVVDDNRYYEFNTKNQVLINEIKDANKGIYLLGDMFSQSKTLLELMLE